MAAMSIIGIDAGLLVSGGALNSDSEMDGTCWKSLVGRLCWAYMDLMRESPSSVSIWLVSSADEATVAVFNHHSSFEASDATDSSATGAGVGVLVWVGAIHHSYSALA